MDATKMEQLGDVIDAVDAESPAGQAEQQAQAQAADAAEHGAREWGMVVYMVGRGLSMIAPELQQVYTDDACMAWGHSMQPVAEKYGWNGPGNVPEIGLVLATASLAVPSYLVIRKRLEVLREEREKAEREERARRGPTPAEFAQTVTGAASVVQEAQGDGG